LLSLPPQSGRFTRWRCHVLIVLIMLIIRSSVANAYLSGSGLPSSVAQ